MKTINEIRFKIKLLQDQINDLTIRKDNYCIEKNEFVFHCMSERIANALAKIEALEWVLDERF